MGCDGKTHAHFPALNLVVMQYESNMNHVELVKFAIPLWYAQIAWAKELIMHGFNLEKAEHILRPEYRGMHQIPGTTWYMRTHGVGVDIFKTPAVGGIDFDFDKPDPDEWRMRIFIEKQVNEGNLQFAMYHELIDDEELMKSTIAEALS